MHSMHSRHCLHTGAAQGPAQWSQIPHRGQVAVGVVGYAVGGDNLHKLGARVAPRQLAQALRQDGAVGRAAARRQQAQQRGRALDRGRAGSSRQIPMCGIAHPGHQGICCARQLWRQSSPPPQHPAPAAARARTCPCRAGRRPRRPPPRWSLSAQTRPAGSPPVPQTWAPPAPAAAHPAVCACAGRGGRPGRQSARDSE